MELKFKLKRVQYLTAEVGSEKEPVSTEIPCLLPHEILAAVYNAGPLQARVDQVVVLSLC